MSNTERVREETDFWVLGSVRSSGSKLVRPRRISDKLRAKLLKEVSPRKLFERLNVKEFIALSKRLRKAKRTRITKRKPKREKAV